MFKFEFNVHAKKHRPLSLRQRKYIAAYLEHLEGARAAREAGYPAGRAKYAHRELQQNRRVREAIERGLAELEQELKDKCLNAMRHTYSQAIAEITDLFDDEGNPLPISKMPRHARRAISAIEVEFDEVIEDGVLKRRPRVARVKLHDKRASQELFAKYAGKMKEQVQVDATKSFEQVVLEAARMRQERDKKLLPAPQTEPQTEDANE